MSSASAAAAAAAGSKWRIIPRPLLETILHNHALHHRVPQPLLLHGPRGVGKSSLLLSRLIPEWNKGPHMSAYVDFAADATAPKPWASFCGPALADVSDLRLRLERALESLCQRGILLGAVGPRDVYAALNKWHGIRNCLSRIAGPTATTSSISSLWTKAVLSRINRGDDVITLGIGDEESKYKMEEVAYMKEAAAALRVAKEVVGMQEDWRRNAVRELNKSGRFSRSLANSATDWPCLLLDILSAAAEVDYFQVWL